MAVNDMVFCAKEMREFKRSTQTLGEYVSRKIRKLTEPELANAILRACCAVTGTDFTKALSRSRLKEDVLARFFSMYFLKDKLPKLSLKTIGKYYCRPNHATVIHAIREVRRIINPKYKDPASELFFAAEKEVTMNLEMYVAS